MSCAELGRSSGLRPHCGVGAAATEAVSVQWVAVQIPPLGDGDGDELGVELSARNVVVWIVQGSLAERSGLHVLDRIVEVNGRPSSAASIAADVLGQTNLCFGVERAMPTRVAALIESALAEGATEWLDWLRAVAALAAGDAEALQRALDALDACGIDVRSRRLSQQDADFLCATGKAASDNEPFEAGDSLAVVAARTANAAQAARVGARSEQPPGSPHRLNGPSASGPSAARTPERRGVAPPQVRVAALRDEHAPLGSPGPPPGSPLAPAVLSPRSSISTSAGDPSSRRSSVDRSSRRSSAIEAFDLLARLHGPPQQKPDALPATSPRLSGGEPTSDAPSLTLEGFDIREDIRRRRTVPSPVLTDAPLHTCTTTSI